MPKTLPEPYAPSNPPDKFTGWARWITEELNRVAAAINASPVILHIEGAGTINVDGVPHLETLGIGDEPEFDYPGASWDTVLGEWTASLNGIYSVTVGATVEPFGSGNKSYHGELELYINDVLRFKQSDGGADDVPLGLSLSTDVLILAGDLVRMVFFVVHEQFTGTSAYDYNISYKRDAAG